MMKGVLMPKLLFLGMGLGETKRYIAEALLDEGYQLVVLTERLPAWIIPAMLYGESADLNAAAAAEHAIMIGRTHAVDGVFTCDEAYVELSAEVARGLGRPGLTEQAATACRDKHAMRRRLAEAGIPSARSMMADSLAQARLAAEMIGYPVVLKPRNLGGSIGVVRAEGPADVERFFAVASRANMSRIRALPGLLVEDYLDGPEFSVESVTIDGVTTVCGITEKVLGFAPFFEETGHFARPVDLGDTRDARFADITSSVHEALGITTGVTHCELRVTADGPHVIEIGGRVGGDRIPVITKLASGIDLIAAAAAVATGVQPDLEPITARVAGIRMVYPDHDGVITRLDVKPLASGVLEEMGWYASVGQSVVLPPRGFLSRLAYLVAVGETKAEVVRRLDEGEAALAIEIAGAGDPRGSRH
jgi:biotin carboxylase